MISAIERYGFASLRALNFTGNIINVSVSNDVNYLFSGSSNGDDVCTYTDVVEWRPRRLSTPSRLDAAILDRQQPVNPQARKSLPVEERHHLDEVDKNTKQLIQPRLSMRPLHKQSFFGRALGGH
jgi:hypothetical protein